MKKLIFSLFVATGVPCLLLFRNGSAADESKPDKEYALRGQITKGETQVLSYNRELTLDAQIPAMPRHTPIKIYEKVSQKISQKIIEVKDNHPAKTERKYDESSLQTSTKKGTTKPDNLDKKTVKIALKENKIQVEAPISDTLKKTLVLDENNFLLLLPADKVKIDDEWQVASATLTSVFNFTTTRRRALHHGSLDLGLKPIPDNGEMTCKLKEVQTIKGQETAVIEMRGKLEAEENGLTNSITLSGTGYFLIAKGKFSRLEFAGEITLAGDQPCGMNQPPNKVEGNGKLNLTVEFK